MRVAGHAHHAGAPLDDLVVGGCRREWAALPEAADRAVDEVVAHFAQRLITETEPVHRAGPKIIEHDVRARHEAPKNRVAVLAFQVQRERALAGVLRERGGAHAAPVQRGVGAEQRELIARERAGQHVGQIEHAHARQ